jgi:protein-tyrosine phosphatase
LLVVCTGNVCRSPFIERMLALALPPGFAVSSAGTAALIGEPIDPQAADQLRLHGAKPDGFVARQLTAEMVAEADLVLTATRAHRAEVVSLWPRAMSYAFTLGDLGDLTQGLPAAARTDVDVQLAREAARTLAGRRGLVPPRRPKEVDVIDPYGREDRVFAAMADQIVRALPPVVRLLSR